MLKNRETFIPKAILTDVDCTLLNSDRQLSKENRETIKHYLLECRNNPNLPRLALCTARHPAALINTVLPVFTEFAPDSLHVVCNGAMLINSKAEIISQEVFPSAITRQICQDVECLGGSFVFGYQDAFYCGKDFFKERSQSKELIKSLPYSAIADQENWTTSLLVINHLNEQVEAYIRGLHKRLDFHLNKILSTFNHQPYYNLTLPNVSKAKGVKKWAEHYQLETEKVIMIGDGDNDLEIMKESVGIAVANAQSEVKNLAQLVLQKSNDDDAVAWVLQELLKLPVFT